MEFFNSFLNVIGITARLGQSSLNIVGERCSATRQNERSYYINTKEETKHRELHWILVKEVIKFKRGPGKEEIEWAEVKGQVVTWGKHSSPSQA